MLQVQLKTFSSLKMAGTLMLVTALSPVIGYDKASVIAHSAIDNDQTLEEAALASGFINKDEFEKVVDPEKMISN